MQYRLVVKPEITFEQLERQIADGARFIVFPYCISLIFAVALRRLSPAIFITESRQLSRYARKYRTVSLICGWWCLPWGIVRTLDALSVIKKGGLDVTADIMQNLDAAALSSGIVELRQVHTIYAEPDTSALKSMKKMLSPVFNNDSSIHKIVAALFVNTKASYFVIGLEADSLAAFYADRLKTALYKDFYKTVHFEFIDLASEDGTLLAEQGVLLFDRNNIAVK